MKIYLLTVSHDLSRAGSHAATVNWKRKRIRGRGILCIESTRDYHKSFFSRKIHLLPHKKLIMGRNLKFLLPFFVNLFFGNEILSTL
jgi:hypothetical protein